MRDALPYMPTIAVDGFAPDGIGGYVWETNDVIRQLGDAGVLPFLVTPLMNGLNAEGKVEVRAIAKPELLKFLKKDPRWKSGPGWRKHRDVGDDLIDFRAIGGSFGVGSPQIVLDKKTNAFYADIDEESPYDDVVGLLKHNLRILFKKTPAAPAS